jgi:hypothetical protein
MDHEQYIEQEFEAAFSQIGLRSGEFLSLPIEQLNEQLDLIDEIFVSPAEIFFQKNLVNRNEGGYVYHPFFLPHLLEKRKAIYQALAEKRREQESNKIEILLDNYDDKQLQKEIKRHISESKNYNQTDLLKFHEADLLQVVLAQMEKQKDKEVERFEKRTNLLKEFLERKRITLILGFSLLILFSIVEIVILFMGKMPGDRSAIDNAFWIIMGYFFGTSISDKKPNSNGIHDPISLRSPTDLIVDDCHTRGKEFFIGEEVLFQHSRRD